MGEQEYLSLAGTVTSIIYQNEENGYTVLRMRTDEEEETTVVGCIPGAVPGEQLEVFGEWARHPQHGAQFKATWSQRSLPETEDGIYSYLASGAIKGIGPATATQLLMKFGAQTLDIIENEPTHEFAIDSLRPSKENRFILFTDLIDVDPGLQSSCSGYKCISRENALGPSWK